MDNIDTFIEVRTAPFVNVNRYFGLNISLLILLNQIIIWPL